MPRPTSGTTIQRPDLASLAVEFMEDQGLFVGLKVAPLFRVAAQSADYPTYPKEAAVNIPDTKRTAEGHYNRIQWRFETDSYSCVENGIEEPVDDVEVKLYARYFDAEALAAKRVGAAILRVQEKRILDAIQAETADKTITHEWDDATNAVPLSDINTGKNTVIGLTGVEPNTLVIANTTFQDLGVCDEIIGRIKYTYPGVRAGELTKELLAEYFGLDQVVVSIAQYNSAKEGQTASLSYMWSEEYAALLCVESGQDLSVPSYMRTFLWTEDSPENVVMESYYDDTVRGNVIRGRQYTDEETIWSGAIYMYENVYTA